jgi:isoleucyl-tRNA synthetase
VLRFTDDWHRYVTRQARWVDFDNDYKTLDLPYMESVMWAFKTLWDKGLIYEGFRVLAYCWRCETPLSNTETRMDDVYRDRQDPALTVQFQLETGEKILAWTTTPWTLPSNLALAVGPDIDYAVMEESDGQRYILAESAPGRVREASSRTPPRSARSAAPTSSAEVHAAVPVLRRHAQRVPRARRRLRQHRGRHRRGAHGTRLR